MEINIFIVLLGLLLLSYIIISIIEIATYVVDWGVDIEIILFAIIRILPFLSVGFVLFFTYPELKLFCLPKIVVLLFIVSFEIAIIEMWQSDTLDFEILSLVLLSICLLLFIISLITGVWIFFNPDIEYIDSKVETVEVLTASDSLAIDGEIHGSALGSIHGYIKNDELMYSYYYISDDGKKVLHNEFKESNLKDRIILDEGEDAYIEITTEQYIKNIEINPKVYSGKKTYTIYAPLSAYSGIGFDAK